MATRTLNIRIVGDSRNLNGALASSEGRLAKFGKAAGAAGAVAAGALAVGLKKAVDTASDVSESLAKNEQLFGRHAAGVDKWSQSTARSMGVSRQAALEATGTFGNLFTALEIAPGKAAGMSKALVGLAGDMASFNNASPEEALEAIRSGLVGETEPLRRFGINMNDATLRAEALKQGLVKSTKESLDPQTKALAANALMFQQTKKAQGDFERTSGGLANQQRILKATLTDVGGTVGAIVLPTLTNAANAVTGFIHGMQDGEGAGGRFADRLRVGFERVKAAVETVRGAVAGFLAALRGGEIWAGALAGAIGGLAVAMAAMRIGAFVSGIVAAGRAAIVAAGGIKAMTVAMLTNPIGIAVTALAALGAGLVVAYQRSETFRNIVNGAWSSIRENAVPAVMAVKNATLAAFEAIRAGVGAAIGFIRGWINRHRDDISAFGNAWKNIGRAVLVAIGALATGLKFHFENVIVPAMRVVLAVARAVWPSIQRIVEAALRAIGGLVNVFAGVFTGDWRRAWNGVKQIFSGAKDALLALVGGLLKGIVALVGGIGRELFNAANRLGGFLKRGIADGLKGFGNAIKDMIVEGVTWAAKNVPRLIGSALKGLGGAITSAIKSGFSKLNPFGGMGDAMGTPSFPGMPGGAAPLGGLPTSGLHSVASRGLSFINSRFGAVRLTSGRRSVEENRRVGGAPNSDHLTGLGTDLVPAGGWNPAGVALLDRVANWAKSSPLIRWIGWRGVPGHGPGDHLHLSWVANRGGVGDVAMKGGKLKAYGGKVRGVGDVSGKGHVQLIRDAAAKAGIDPAILYGVWGAESGFSRGPGPTSPAGAQGPFQFMAATARGMGVNPGDLTSSAYGAARYLAQYKGRGIAGMLAAYNAGPAGNPNNPETRAYIPKVQRIARQWASIAGSTRTGGGGSGTTSVGGTGGTTTGGGGGGGGGAPAKAAPAPTYGPKAAAKTYGGAVEALGLQKAQAGNNTKKLQQIVIAEMVLKNRRLAVLKRALKKRLTKVTRTRLTQEATSLIEELKALSELMADLTDGTPAGEGPAEAAAAAGDAGGGGGDSGGGGVGAGPVDPGPTMHDWHGSAMARARLTEGLGDDIAAQTSYRDFLAGEMNAALADADPRNDAEAINAYLSAKEAVEELTKTMNTANEIQQRRDELNRQIADNQLKILALANQGPQIVAAVVAAVSGGIGGPVGLGLQTPGYAGSTARY